MKQLWKGVFNYRAGMIRIYRYANTERQARLVMAGSIACKQGVQKWEVLKWMKEHGESWKITQEPA